MNRYKILLIIVLLFPVQVRALSLKCPEMVSENESFSCIIEDKGYRGISTKYNYDNVFSYVDSKIISGNGYYIDNYGSVIGNSLNKELVKIEVKFKTNSVISKYGDYYISLRDIDTSDDEYKGTKIGDISSKIRLVSDINTLDKLEINNGKFDKLFKSSITSYSAIVNSSSTVISAQLSDKSAKLEGDIGKKELKYGINVFSIRVISVRGNTREYKLYITRPYKVNNIKKSSDATLRSLKIIPGNIKFKRDVFYYNVDVDNSINDIKVEAIPNNSKAKVKVNKPDRLVVGDNEIKIDVTSEDGNKLSYIIVVHKKEKLSSDNKILKLIIKGYDIDFKSNVYKYDLNIYNEDKLDIIVELSDKDASYKILGNKNLVDKSIIKIVVEAPDGSKKSYIININKIVGANSKGLADYIRIIPVIVFIILMILIIVLKIFKSNIKK